MGNNTSNLARLPLELRNAIYRYTIGDITSLTLPHPPLLSAATQPFQKKLPPCLLLNHQIALEATHAFIDLAALTVRNLTLSNPLDLLSVISHETKLASLLSLRFTSRQPHYSGFPTSVHSLIQRCPNLQHLTLPLPSSFFLSDDYESNLAPIFSHPALLKVHITCSNAPYLKCSWVSAPNAELFEPFDQWWRDRGSRIEMSIDLSPGRKKNGDPQCVRQRRGGIEWFEVQDWFG
jgi:hypothetical protein